MAKVQRQCPERGGRRSTRSRRETPRGQRGEDPISREPVVDARTMRRLRRREPVVDARTMRRLRRREPVIDARTMRQLRRRSSVVDARSKR
ncbi:unnamed protein product [Sphagnum balticum]